MANNEIILECPDCGTKQLEEMPVPMVMSAAAARFKAMSICVTCGKKKVALLTGERYRAVLGEMKSLGVTRIEIEEAFRAKP